MSQAPSIPLYEQLASELVDAVLDGRLEEGSAIPSVRQLAAQQQINPLTVQRALALLADRGIIERRRGQGSTVAQGARQKLLIEQRQQFLEHDWPKIRAQIKRLGLDLHALSSEANGEVDGNTD
ncbi:MAG: GntR family transcriptional regulator [Pseudomonadota bacterium]|uniref:GntR family transcriptional regulator n=1 Tax=Gallaecimonas pentaromativorans TaxID=584787 RepID=UPI00067F1ACA|nr:GntR family transcriptional regulator [Gallaecimonas pentaromativorans]MED5523818.1 GntR family transcriptional regulator [Pseudomonadota bacterium]